MFRVGVDIVNIKRIERVFEKFNTRFINRIFTEEELEMSKLAKDLSKFYGKRFAAKEAFSKAVGLGIGSAISWQDVSILSDNKGKPYIKLSAKLKAMYKNQGFDVSISDEYPYAFATVISFPKSF